MADGGSLSTSTSCLDQTLHKLPGCSQHHAHNTASRWTVCTVIVAALVSQALTTYINHKLPASSVIRSTAQTACSGQHNTRSRQITGMTPSSVQKHLVCQLHCSKWPSTQLTWQHICT
jgi:hypothetical protein